MDYPTEYYLKILEEELYKSKFKNRKERRAFEKKQKRLKGSKNEL